MKKEKSVDESLEKKLEKAEERLEKAEENKVNQKYQTLSSCFSELE